MGNFTLPGYPINFFSFYKAAQISNFPETQIFLFIYLFLFYFFFVKLTCPPKTQSSSFCVFIPICVVFSPSLLGFQKFSEVKHEIYFERPNGDLMSNSLRQEFKKCVHSRLSKMQIELYLIFSYGSMLKMMIFKLKNKGVFY